MTVYVATCSDRGTIGVYSSKEKAREGVKATIGMECTVVWTNPTYGYAVNPSNTHSILNIEEFGIDD